MTRWRSPEPQATAGSRRVHGSLGDPPVLGESLGALVGRHAVEHQDAVEMVEFVLIHPGLEVTRLVLDDLTVEIDPAQQDVSWPDHLDEETRDREAPLVVHPLPRRLDDLGIEDDPSLAVEVPHEDLLLDPDLGSGQGDAAIGVVERVEHLVDEADDPPVDVGDRGGVRLEDRIAEGADLVGHAWQAICTVPQYFDDPSALASDPETVSVTLADIAFEYTSDRGVFSHGHLDEGTALLLQEAPPPSGSGDLLDLGCGAGPIALTLARRSPAARVWAVDVNPRAVALTDANGRSASVRVDARLVEDMPAEVTFATIWSNPPIRIGKVALHAMLTTWLGRLDRTGSAVLVVNRHLGADSLQRWLTGAGWDVARLTSRRGFRLLEIRHPTGSADRVDGDADAPPLDPDT